MEQRITKWHFAMDKKFQSRIVWCVVWCVASVACTEKRICHLFIHLQSAHTMGARSTNFQKNWAKANEKMKMKNSREEKREKILIQRDSWNKCAENLNADIFRYIAARVNSTHHHSNTKWLTDTMVSHAVC